MLVIAKEDRIYYNESIEDIRLVWAGWSYAYMLMRDFQSQSYPH